MRVEFTSCFVHENTIYPAITFLRFIIRNKVNKERFHCFFTHTYVSVCVCVLTCDPQAIVKLNDALSTEFFIILISTCLAWLFIRTIRSSFVPVKVFPFLKSVCPLVTVWNVLRGRERESEGGGRKVALKLRLNFSPLWHLWLSLFATFWLVCNLNFFNCEARMGPGGCVQG